MKGDVPVREAFGAESPVQGVFLNSPAVHRQKDPAAFRVLTKRHIFAQPALYPPALIVIASGALLSKLIAVPEAVNVKRAEINPDPAEIFNQFAVSHKDNLPLLHAFIHVEALLR